MIRNIRIKTNDLNYSIKIGNGVFKKTLYSFKKIKSKKFILIDTKVYNIYKFYFKSIIINDAFLIKINSSEKIKSINKFWSITSQLLNNGINRSSVIITIGGGTLGDLTGFVASTILRGVKFILVPTTLLSQVDSSIGGKNGINTKFGKNLVGTFYQPNLVIIDPIFLKSLPYNEIKFGYTEILKHALINDKKFFYWLKSNYKYLLKLKNKEITYAIEKSIKIKAKYIANDEKEILKNSHSRAILNFGHSFGHALESLNNYKSSLPHGKAVSIGMAIASKISYLIGNLSKNQLDEIMIHLKNCNLPTNSNLIKNENFIKILIRDKKNQDGKINLILLKGIGEAYFAKNFKIKEVKKMVNKKL